MPPRIGSRTSSMPSARIARSATSTTCGNVSTKRRMFGYCGRSVTVTRARGSLAATASAVRRISAPCSASSASSKSRAMKRTTARPASPESSKGWMYPSRPSVVSGVSESRGQLARAAGPPAARR